MGIEPTSSAWKAEVLPLNYSRLAYCHNNRTWWREVDSNHRRHSQLIYSQPPLAAWVSLRDGAHYCVFDTLGLSTGASRKSLPDCVLFSQLSKQERHAGRRRILGPVGKLFRLVRRNCGTRPNVSSERLRAARAAGRTPYSHERR